MMNFAVKSHLDFQQVIGKRSQLYIERLRIKSDALDLAEAIRELDPFQSQGYPSWQHGFYLLSLQERG